MEDRHAALSRTPEMALVMLDQLHCGVAVESQEGGLEFVNPYLANLVNQPMDSFQGRKFVELVPDYEKQRVERFHEDLFQGHRERMEYRTRLKGDELVPVRVLLVSVVHDRKIKVVATIWDSREEGLVKRALEEAESRYRDFVENAHEIMLMLDSLGRISWVNRAFEALLGHPREEVVGQALKNFVAGMPKETSTSLHEILWKQGWAVFSAFMTSSSGESMPVEITATVVYDDVGKMIGGRVVARPMADRSDGIINLMKRDRVATISNLISSATHELNNPLTIVLGNAELILMDETDPVKREMLEEVIEAGKRCRQTIDEMKQFSRSNSNSQREVGLENLLTAALELLSDRVEKSGITLEKDLAGVPMPLLVDPTLFQQALTYLIETALLSAMARGRHGVVWISTRLEHGVARLELADNGPTLPPHLRTQARDPFLSVSPEAGSHNKYGLGMSITSGIISGYGGQVFESSSSRKGNSIVVLLPLVKRDVQTVTK